MRSFCLFCFLGLTIGLDLRLFRWNRFLPFRSLSPALRDGGAGVPLDLGSSMTTAKNGPDY